jgi:diaminopimelate epimerase
MGETDHVILRKLHGWGNDFLVALDADQPDGALDLDAVGALAPTLCDRHRGVGADGLIHGAAGGDGADVTMTLFNADGSRAEMSGNGIRCLAHAVVWSSGEWSDTVVIDTVVGRRALRLRGGTPGTAVPDEVVVEVPMGAVGPGPASDSLADALGAHRHLTRDVGNPHLVVEVPDPAVVALAELGPRLEASFPSGVNVEVVAVSDGVVDLAVWERGVGVTEACGTGACAAAHAARQWGLVGDSVAVRMPGGEALVVLDGDEATLVGPSVAVATVEVA